MKRRVILVYDCPLKRCDKLWVYNGLKEAGYEVKVIDAPFPIGHLDQRGRVGVILALLVIIIQSLWAVIVSKPNDIIFCWLQKSGIYVNKFSRGKRRILSYNWLTPRPKKQTRKLYADALENPLFRAIVNSKENKEKNLQAYQAKDIDNIYYIPDVYDESIQFRVPVYKEEADRYCFMGGRANRDWKLFLEAAKKCPDIQFVGVAAACDWNKDMKIPDNVDMKFDISAKEYYDLMRNAYLAVYPLEQERVSGLINILRGTMEGLPVLITDLSVTGMYYDMADKDMLFGMGNCDEMCNRIRTVYSWDESQYVNKIAHMQAYIKVHFSPEMAIEAINSIFSDF